MALQMVQDIAGVWLTADTLAMLPLAAGARTTLAGSVAARHAHKVVDAAGDLVIGLLQVKRHEAVRCLLAWLQAKGVRVVGWEALNDLP